MILSYQELEDIGAAVIHDFRQSFCESTRYLGKKYAIATPIDQLASQYLGLHVS